MTDQITTPDQPTRASELAKLVHQPRSEQGLVFTTSLHEATFIGTVTGVRPACFDSPAQTPGGKPQKRWAFPSTHEVDEAKALWCSVGLPAFGQPKDWSAMTLDEKKACTNVATAFAANLRVFLKDVHNT